MANIIVVGSQWGDEGKEKIVDILTIDADMVVRYAIRINGLTGIIITKMEVLDAYKAIKICTGYKYKGKLYNEMPAELNILEGCEPVYEVIEGWNEDTSGITEYDMFPEMAKPGIFGRMRGTATISLFIAALSAACIIIFLTRKSIKE